MQDFKIKFQIAKIINTENLKQKSLLNPPNITLELKFHFNILLLYIYITMVVKFK